MTAGLIALIVLALFVFIIAAPGVRIVPQARAGVVERLGRYSRTLEPGLTLIVPFIDRVKPLIDLREQVVTFPPQPVITEDNLVVGIDTVIYFTVTDPRAATYEVANPLQAIEQLTVTTLRNVIGGMTLEETLTSRDNVNHQLRAVLDEATGRWGIRVNRVELKSVEPPRTVQEAMEKQMRAERDRRATILTAEGQAVPDPHRRGREAVRRPARRGPAHRRDPAGRGRGEGDRDRLRRDPRRRARPGAALLPVPADAAADRPGRREQGLRDPVGVLPGALDLAARFADGIAPRRAEPRARNTEEIDARAAADAEEAARAAPRPPNRPRARTSPVAPREIAPPPPEPPIRALDDADAAPPGLEPPRAGAEARHRLDPVVGVQRRHLVGLGERRVVEDRGDEEVEPARAGRHHGLADVDEIRRARAEHVDAEDPAVLGGDEELQYPSRSPEITPRASSLQRAIPHT